MINAIADIDEQFPDYARLLEDLSRVLQQIAVHQVVGAIQTEDEAADAELAQLATAIAAEDVQLFYQIAVLGRRDLQLAPDPRGGAEMTLLRMLAFRPASASTGNTGGGSGAEKSKLAASGTAPAAKVVRAHTVEPSPAVVANWQEPNWSELTDELTLPGAVRLLAGNCAYLRREDSTVFLSIDPRSESLLTRPRKEALAAALYEKFGEDLSVDIAIGEAAEETPLQKDSRRASEKMDAARESLESDPNVIALQDMFGAELKTDSIELINPSQND